MYCTCFKKVLIVSMVVLKFNMPGGASSELRLLSEGLLACIVSDRLSPLDPLPSGVKMQRSLFCFSYVTCFEYLQHHKNAKG